MIGNDVISEQQHSGSTFILAEFLCILSTHNNVNLILDTIYHV